MKLFFHKNLKDPVYYAQQTIRNGKKTTTRNVKRLGKHSELLKLTDDPEGYAREKIREMNAEYRVGRSSYTMTVDFNERVDFAGSSSSIVNVFNIGYFFLQDIMKELSLKDFFKGKTSGRMIPFDCFTISRFLTYSRILDPASKLDYSKRLGSYYERPDFNFLQVLRFMDLLAENYNDYLAWLYQNSKSVVQRDTTVLYYLCSNFSLESNNGNNDYVDEVTGETLPELRQYGIIQEHSSIPLAKMELFLDSQGIPITMGLFLGNPNEPTTAIPLGEEVVKMRRNAKFIYCADAGINSSSLHQFKRLGVKSFIVSQSIKKLSRSLQKVVFEDQDYRLLSTDAEVSIEQLKEFDRTLADHRSWYDDIAYKVIPVDKAVDLGLCEEQVWGDGSAGEGKSIEQPKPWVIITFSRKALEYQRAIRNDQIEVAEVILQFPDQWEDGESAENAKRFIKKVRAPKGKGKPGYEYVLDKEKIAEEEKYDGFYAVATNLDDPVRDILAISLKKDQIEECFRLNKTYFPGRPMFYGNPNRITAHFLICFTALLVFRMLEVKLNQRGAQVTSKDLIQTLRGMKVRNNHDVEYAALYDGSEVLNALTGLSTLILDRCHYRPKDLNKFIKHLLK